MCHVMSDVRLAQFLSCAFGYIQMEKGGSHFGGEIKFKIMYIFIVVKGASENFL